MKGVYRLGVAAWVAVSVGCGGHPLNVDGGSKTAAAGSDGHAGHGGTSPASGGATGVAGDTSGSGGAMGGVSGAAGGGAGAGGAFGAAGAGVGGASGAAGASSGGAGAVGTAGAVGVAGAAGAGGIGGSGGGGVLVDCDNRCEVGEMCLAGSCTGGTSRWPTLGGDLHHSGFNANETGTPPLKRDWSVPLDGPGGLWPAVSDGNAIYVSADAYFGKTTNLWALSPDDGHTLWTHEFGDLFGIGQASVDGDHVYIAQCNNAGSTFMYSFVAATGTLFWSMPFGAQWEKYWAPVVTPGGDVFFDGGSYGGLYGLTVTGDKVFFDGMLEQYDEWTPLFLGGRLYSFIAGNLRTHDLKTGAVTTTVSVPWNWAGWSMETSPISDGTRIYFIAPPTLYALSVGHGNPDWSSDAAYAGMPAVANGVVYAISGGQLRALDASTGAVLWTFPGDSKLQYPPVGAGRWVYVASDDNVYGVDTMTQDMVWSDTPGGWLSIAGGRVLVAQKHGTLAAHALTPPNP